jgi:hypothetical protein
MLELVEENTHKNQRREAQGSAQFRVLVTSNQAVSIRGGGQLY